MTRYDVCDRVRDELESAFPGEQAFVTATVDDVDQLTVAIGAALEDVREQLASAERAQAERNEQIVRGAVRDWIGTTKPG